MKHDSFFFRQTDIDLTLGFLSVVSVNKVLAHSTLTVQLPFPADQFFLWKTYVNCSMTANVFN